MTDRPDREFREEVDKFLEDIEDSHSLMENVKNASQFVVAWVDENGNWNINYDGSYIQLLGALSLAGTELKEAWYGASSG